MTPAPRDNTPSTRRADPVSLILGADAAGSPWSLLGLAPGAVSDRDVAAALEGRLLQVNRHPLGGIPEADDVRLALHAAAAQVLHPEVRQRLLNLGPSADESPAQGSREDADIDLDPVLRIIAMHGGINEQSIRRLMLLTADSSISAEGLAAEIQAKLVAWSHRSKGSRGVRPARPPQSRPAGGATVRATTSEHAVAATDLDEYEHKRNNDDDEVDPGVRTLKIIIVSSLAVICATAVIIVGVLLILNKPKGGAWTPQDTTPAQAAQGSPPRQGELFPSAKEPPPRPSEKTPDPAPPQNDPVALVRALASCAADVATKKDEAREAFATAAGSLATRWHLLAPDQLGAAQDSIIEFLYRSPDPATADAALDAVLRARDDGGWTEDRVRGELWRAGLLSRLAREKDLPAGVRAGIDAQGGRSIRTDEPGTFARGALTRLSSLPLEMVSPPKGLTAVPPPSPAQAKQIQAAWKAWSDAAKLISAGDEAALDGVLLTGLETILIDGPEPPQDYGLEEVIKEQVLALSWRKDSAARRWLVASFSSTELTNADLAIVTRTLAGRSGAEGVDAKMTLLPGADDKERMALRDAYASAWGMSDPARRDEMLDAWRQQVQIADQPLSINSREDENHVGALGSAVTKARLNLAATMIWAGLIEEPAALIKDPASLSTALVGQALTATRPQRIDEGGTDGSWAVQYLAVDQRVPERLKFLAELSKANRPLGLVDAEVVVSEAMRGAPESVRSAARDVLDHWADTPPVLYALLQEAYRIPKTRSNGLMVASITLGKVPSLRDPQWHSAVRRALVEKLLQSIAARGPEKAIDLLSEELAGTCAHRAKPADAALGTTDSSAAARIKHDRADPIGDLLAQWRRTAEPLLATGKEPLTLGDIDRHLSSRLSLSQGPVQEFAARHLAVVETMAYVVSIEQPSHAREVVEIMAALAADRRKAEHVLDQIDSAETAMMRLWKVRLGGGVS